MNFENTRINEFFDEFEKTEEGDALMSNLDGVGTQLNYMDARHYEEPLFCNSCGDYFSEQVCLGIHAGWIILVCRDCLEDYPSVQDLGKLKQESTWLTEDRLDFSKEDLKHLEVQESKT